MDSELSPNLDLLNFFKALADGTRLQLAGQLARGATTPQALATALNLRLPVVLAQLAHLEALGLVSPQANGRYKLRLDRVHTLAARVHTAPPQPAVEDTADAFERQVFLTFLNPDGSIRAFPTQDKKFLVILRYVRDQFDRERHYTEKEVNTLIKRLHPDSATLRRCMVENGWMARANGEYWRME